MVAKALRAACKSCSDCHFSDFVGMVKIGFQRLLEGSLCPSSSSC